MVGCESKVVTCHFLVDSRVNFCETIAISNNEDLGGWMIDDENVNNMRMRRNMSYYKNNK